MAKSALFTRTFSYGTWKVRLDVDGNYPQNLASITLAAYNAHWVADADATGATDTWAGNCWYRNAGASTLVINDKKPDNFKFVWGEDASIGKYLNLYLYEGETLVTAFGLYHESDHFRQVDVELDYETGVDVAAAKSVTVGGTTHTLENIYEKAGAKITVNTSGNAVGAAAAGADAKWSDAELHDAMQNHWSKDDGTPWAMWIFFCKEATDPDLAGKMFDSSDAHQRQGTAIFVDSHDGLLREDEYLFHTVVHEVGHAFNLAHSWIKTSDPWCSGIVNEPRALSFMNYPWKYTEEVYFSQDYRKFFDDFGYRFSDQELQFLRHAPEAMVSMGQSDFMTDHGSVLEASSQVPAEGSEGQPIGKVPFSLEVRVNKAQPVFQFLEPVRVELKLKNTGSETVKVEKKILNDLSRMGLWVRRNQEAPCRYAAYARPCAVPKTVDLAPGESLYGSVFLSAGTNGWVVAEPGRYGVSMALSLDDGQVVSSNELQFTVLAPPKAVRAEAERLAQDYFSDGVGRALAFGGSRALTKANDALRDLAARFPDRNAARHAEVAVNLPESGEYKLVEFDAAGQGKLNLQKPTAAGVQGAKKALVDNAAATVETMGHIAYKEQMDQFSQKAASQGDTKTAVAAQRTMLATLDKRGVKLPAAVQQEVSETLKKFGEK